MFEFKLPDIGEGVVEGEIVEWLVKEGDTVGEDQPIVEVLTDKATVVIPSPRAGTVTSIPWANGDIVPVGDTLIVLDAGAEPASASPTPEPAPKAAVVEAAPAVVAEPAAVAAPAVVAAPAAPAKKAAPVERVKAAEPAKLVALKPRKERRGRVLAAPTTRRLARELGVDIDDVTGSGKGGRVTPEDIEQAASGPAVGAAASLGSTVAAAPATPRPAAPSLQLTVPYGQDERQKVRGIRKAQANAMVQSFFTAPHFTYVEEIDMTRLVALRSRMKPLALARGAKLSYLPFIMKACAIMLREHPWLNASLDEEAGEFVFHHYYNVGVAVATDRGLTLPVIKAVDQKSILEIAIEVEDKANRARALKLSKEDVTGGTFTITSLGKVGGILATPILTPGEVAIVGIHNIFDRPRWENGTWVPAKIMYLSASFDHRVVDGYTGATAIQRAKQLLEDPELFLMELR